MHSHWLLVLACAGLACTQNERPPLTYEDTRGGRGGRVSIPEGGEPGTEGGAGGSGATGGGSGSSGNPIDNPALENPDPRSVYLVGPLFTGTATECLSHWSEPSIYAVGMTSVRGWQIGDAGLYYLDSNERIRLFVPELITDTPKDDLVYPTDPTGNDPFEVTPTCGDSGVESFVVGPNDRILHSCFGSIDWYDREDIVFSSEGGQIVALGNDDMALVRDSFGLHVLDLSSGEMTLIETNGLSDYTFRAVNGGFHGLAIGPETTELWEVSADGSTRSLGTYPPLPDEITPSESFGQTRLDANDEVFHITTDFRASDEPGVVVRRSLDEPFEIVYSRADDPAVLATELVTGP